MDSKTKPFFAKDLIETLQDRGYKVSFSSNLVENPDPREVNYYEQSSININGDRFDLWKTSVLFIAELELLCFLKNSDSKSWHFEITIVNISSLQIVSLPPEFFYEHEVEIIGSSKDTFSLKLEDQLVNINVSDFPNVDVQRLEDNSIPTDQITPTRIEQISEPKAPPEEIPLEITPPCPYGFYEHDHGATIFFDLDLLDKSELFKLIGEIPGLQVTTSDNLFQSFGPLESTDEYHSSQGSFIFNSSWEGMDTGHSISSENKTLIQRIVKKLESSPHFVPYKN